MISGRWFFLSQPSLAVSNKSFQSGLDVKSVQIESFNERYHTPRQSPGPRVAGSDFSQFSSRSFRNTLKWIYYRRPDLNRYGHVCQQILSLLCLPIPPRRRFGYPKRARRVGSTWHLLIECPRRTTINPLRLKIIHKESI